MGVTVVCALSSIKPDGIGGVANNPIPFWILRNGVADGVLGKRLTFLVKRLFLIKVFYKEFYINASSYRIVGFNPDYTEGDGHNDTDDDQGCRN